MPSTLIPPWVIKQHNFQIKVVREFMYLLMRIAVWGLPQAGITAKKMLRKQLAPHGYSKCKDTPGLWTHTT